MSGKSNASKWSKRSLSWKSSKSFDLGSEAGSAESRERQAYQIGTAQSGDFSDDEVLPKRSQSLRATHSNSQILESSSKSLQAQNKKRVVISLYQKGVFPRSAFSQADREVLEAKATKAANGWKAWLKGKRGSATDVSAHWVCYSFRQASDKSITSYKEDNVMSLLQAHLVPQDRSGRDILVLEKPFDLGRIEFPQGFALVEFNQVSLLGLSQEEALRIISMGKQRNHYTMIFASPHIVSAIRHASRDIPNAITTIPAEDGVDSLRAAYGTLTRLCMHYLMKYVPPGRWSLFAESLNIEADPTFNCLHAALLRLSQTQSTSVLRLESIFSSRHENHLAILCHTLNASIRLAVCPPQMPLITLQINDMYLAHEDTGARLALEECVRRTPDLSTLLSVFAFIRRLYFFDEEAAVFFCCALAPYIMSPEDPGLLQKLAQEAAEVTYENVESMQRTYDLAVELASKICGDNSKISVDVMLGDPVFKDGRVIPELETASHVGAIVHPESDFAMEVDMIQVDGEKKDWAVALFGALIRHRLKEPLISPYLYEDVLLIYLTTQGDQVDCNFLLQQILPFAANTLQFRALHSLCKVVKHVEDQHGRKTRDRLIQTFAPAVFAPAAFPLTRKDHLEQVSKYELTCNKTFNIMVDFADYIFRYDKNELKERSSKQYTTSVTSASNSTSESFETTSVSNLKQSDENSTSKETAILSDNLQNRDQCCNSKLSDPEPTPPIGDTAALIDFFSPTC